MSSDTRERASTSRIPRTTIEDDDDRCYSAVEIRGVVYFTDETRPDEWDTATGGGGRATDAGGAVVSRQRGRSSFYPPHRVHEVTQESYRIDYPHAFSRQRHGDGARIICENTDCHNNGGAVAGAASSIEQADAFLDAYRERVTEPDPRYVQPEDTGADEDTSNRACVGCGESIGDLHLPSCAL